MNEPVRAPVAKKSGPARGCDSEAACKACSRDSAAVGGTERDRQTCKANRACSYFRFASCFTFSFSGCSDRFQDSCGTLDISQIYSDPLMAGKTSCGNSNLCKPWRSHCGIIAWQHTSARALAQVVASTSYSKSKAPKRLGVCGDVPRPGFDLEPLSVADFLKGSARPAGALARTRAA